MEKILLLQCPETDRIRRLAASVRVPVRVIEATEYKKTLQELYLDRTEDRDRENSYEGTLPQGSLAVFCKLPEKKLDKLLAQLRKNQIPITYKAIMTPTNAKWNVLRLYAEMEREHREFQKLARNSD